MTNREMLELAALAAGYKYAWAQRLIATIHGAQSYPAMVVDGYDWNPIESDSDAFRLMVRLGMDVYIDNHPEGCKCVEAESITHNVGRFVENFRNHESQEAATRLAIVRCAAEIGRGLKEVKNGSV